MPIDDAQRRLRADFVQSPNRDLGGVGESREGGCAGERRRVHHATRAPDSSPRPARWEARGASFVTLVIVLGGCAHATSPSHDRDVHPPASDCVDEVSLRVISRDAARARCQDAPGDGSRRDALPATPPAAEAPRAASTTDYSVMETLAGLAVVGGGVGAVVYCGYQCPQPWDTAIPVGSVVVAGVGLAILGGIMGSKIVAR